jgi:hypothetical protein
MSQGEHRRAETASSFGIAPVVFGPPPLGRYNLALPRWL